MVVVEEGVANYLAVEVSTICGVIGMALVVNLVACLSTSVSIVVGVVKIVLVVGLVAFSAI